MSAKHFFYGAHTLSFERDRIAEEHISLAADNGPPNENNNDNDVDGDEDIEDDFEFLQDVPYSSSSFDRSSIGSIPWADDAIKKNQQDWELVEQMLSGEEPLPAEPELRNEIQEWQRKFPQLLRCESQAKTKNLQPGERERESFDSSRTDANQESLEFDLISNLSINSDDEEGNDFDVTPTASKHAQHTVPTAPNKAQAAVDLSQLLKRDLRISALPLRQRYSRKSSVESTSGEQMQITPRTPTPSRHEAPKSNAYGNKSIRMPPILNVLETKRRFRNLANNQSFVQLTQVPKSAAEPAYLKSVQQKLQAKVAPTPPPRQFASAWNKPLVASRISQTFFNNRNAIILPALHLQRIGEQHSLNNFNNVVIQGGRTRSDSNASFGSSSSNSAAFGRRAPPSNVVSRWHNSNLKSNTNTTSTATVSTGRSVSAAVHQPRLDFGTIYVPYSASKFKSFK